MKNRNLIRILSLFLAVLFCFASCDSGTAESLPDDSTPVSEAETGSIPTPGVIDLSAFSDELGEEDKLSLTHAYAFQPLEERGDGWEYDSQRIEFHEGMLCLHMMQRKELTVLQRCVAYLDTDGSIVKTVPYTQPTVHHYDTEGILESVTAVQMIDEKTFLCSSRTLVIHDEPGAANELDTGYLMLCDAEGNILAETPIPGKGSNSMKRLSDGSIAVLGGESICIFDENLQLKAQVGDGMNTALFESPGGALFAEGKYHGSYYRIDPEAYTCDAETDYDNPQNVKGDSLMFFSPEESGYEVYFTNNDGFWGYNVGDTEAVLLCSWRNSGQVYNNLTVYRVVDENRLLVSVRDPFTNTDTLGWLYRDPTQSTRKKIPIRLGIVEDLLKFGIGVQKSTLENAVMRFNAQNSDYFVEIVDYSSSGDKRGEIPKKFTEAMLEGTAADIIVSSQNQHNAMRIYTTKNAFVDLQNAFGSTLLPCVLSAYAEDNGMLYSVPLNMYLSMPICSEDILASDTPLTLDVLYKFADQTEEAGIALFNTTSYISSSGVFLRELLLSAATPSFADAETGDCFYDSAEFGQFLTFLETLKERAAGEEMLVSHSYGEYMMESTVLAEALQNGDIGFLNFPFHTIDAYARLKLLYGDVAFALHGYPTRDGELVSFSSDIDIHINASSEVQYGAAQFIAYLLSDEFQMFFSDSALPVTVSAVEALLTKTEEYVYSPYDLFRLDTLYDETILSAVYSDAIRVSYSEEDCAVLRRLFYETETTAGMDATMNAILEEELSAYRSGVRTLEETQKVLQSRLWIYINE